MLLQLNPQRGRPGMTRREFLQALSVAMTASAIPMGLSGCAVNPVTGDRQFMVVSEQDEVAIDRKNSPHQFSADYGVTQDRTLNDYVNSVGSSLARQSHRPQMPYNCQVVNAPYVNAYAFPGGSVAATRGILLQLDDEAQLAALLGHEVGHVNARHTASRMSTGVLVGLVAGGAAAAAGAFGGQAAGELAQAAGGLGGGLLLASYSRDDERQADQLGMDYMVKSGYGPDGMVGLMEMLNEQHTRQPSSSEVLFATHPMSQERLDTARQRAASEYAGAKGLPLHRQRYMDTTAALRRMAPSIEAQQQGDEALRRKELDRAEERYANAVQLTPRDYTANVKMAQIKLAKEQHAEARRYAETAQQIYPQEAKAYQVSGFSRLLLRDFDGAYAEFDAYDRRLPGNADVKFFKGYSLEGAGRRQDAARHYAGYLQATRQGNKAQYAAGRLTQWGYAAPR